MKKYECDQTKGVLDAAGDGRMSPHLRKHIKGCGPCQDELLVRGWMTAFSEADTETQPTRIKISDMEAIWEGARSAKSRKKELEKKALRPLLIPRLLTYATILAGAALVIAGQWGPIKQYLGEYSDSLSILNSFTNSVAKIFGSSPLLAAMTGLVTLFMAVFVIYSLIRPEEV